MREKTYEICLSGTGLICCIESFPVASISLQMTELHSSVMSPGWETPGACA